MARPSMRTLAGALLKMTDRVAKPEVGAVKTVHMCTLPDTGTSVPSRVSVMSTAPGAAALTMRAASEASTPFAIE